MIIAVTKPLVKVLRYLISKPFHCFQCSLFTSSISKSNKNFILTIDFDDCSFRMVDGEKLFVGYIYESVDVAKEAIKAKYMNVETKYMPLWDIIDARWDKQLHSPLHIVGCF